MQSSSEVKTEKPSLFSLYFLLFKVGIMTFGGGYAMLPILIRELVEKKHWLTEEELMDYFAIGQCTPGVIAVNTATFTGRKMRGNIGGIVATLGVVSPSIIIITVIAALLRNFADIVYVQDALAGIRVAVCVLMINAIIKMIKSAVIDLPTFIMYVAAFITAAFAGVSPIILVIACGVAGILIKGVFHYKGRKKT